ncbi:hypothetical protein A4G27_12430 [Mycobacterium kansasii]|nr:hypothetical protein A4G27_12430 [Mycobacterium kansasii]
MPTEVIRRPRQRGHRQTRYPGDLVIGEDFVASDETPRRPGIAPDHLDGDVIVDPLRAVQCGRGYTGNDRSASRP